MADIYDEILSLIHIYFRESYASARKSAAILSLS